MTDFLFNESDDFVDAETEAREDELGAEWGDPRRCPRHPGEVTSSPDGMFDAPCGRCEYAMDQEDDYRNQANWEFYIVNLHLDLGRVSDDCLNHLAAYGGDDGEAAKMEILWRMSIGGAS